MNKDGPAWIRFDTGHGSIPAEVGTESVAQWRRQADQIAEHLESRREAIDRLEAELNGRAAELEQGLRLARLRQQEQDRGLGLQPERETRLRSKLAEKWRRLRGRLQRREQALDVAQQRLQREQIESRRLHALLLRNLDRRREALEDQARPSAEPPAVPTSTATPEHLGQLLADVEQERRHLAQQRRDWEAFQRRASQERQHRHAQQEQRFRVESEAVSQRAEVVEQRRLAVRHLHGQTVRMHREMLEMRLAMEQLWGQLRQHDHPASLVRALGQLRRRIADHFQWERQDLQQRRMELTQLARSLRSQQQAVQQRQDQLSQWWRRRLDDVEEEATRLSDWEARLHHQQQDLQRIQESWREERLRLQAKLARWSQAAAVA